MAMTYREYLGKGEIRRKLSEEGYPTYSYLLKDFDIHITKDPKVIGYMVPDKGTITVNEGLDIEQISVVVRHEILHEYFTHHARLLKHLSRDADSEEHFQANIAGDYDISNRGYTDKDKNNMRAIKLNGKLLKCLVTEDDHPDWVGLSFEDMYDKLEEERQKTKAQMAKDLKQKQKRSDEYVKAYNDAIKKYGNLSPEELQNILDSL